jgi:hypothetical protein
MCYTRPRYPYVADDGAYINALFVNANSNTAPGVVYLARKPITDPNEVYSSCYV